MKPKRSDNKYWTGTRNFNHIQYESDLEDYISDLEIEAEQLRLGAVVGQLACPECKSESIKAYNECDDCCHVWDS